MAERVITNFFISHVISTNQRNVFDIVEELTNKNVEVIDTLIPKNVIFINVPKTFDLSSLTNINGVEKIEYNE